VAAMKRIITQHATKDQASPAAAAGPLKIAAFRPGSRAQCRCSLGECSEAACDGLHVFDQGGTKLATFHGANWRAYSDASNPLVIYQLPSGSSPTKDAGQKPLTLADLNRINREFYERGDLW
jgi:hypothetical protein